MPGASKPEHGLTHQTESSNTAVYAPRRAALTAPPARLELLALAIVLVVAALLRLLDLTAFPPGLNQDEAANAWNAWCLLNTGHDQVGQTWPVFCFRALGEYRSALFLYLVLPFQLAGGLNVWTTRLPSALGGLVTVLLTWWVARRMFGPRVGLLTAALLAIDPTHIQMSRLGHEASITPLLTLAPLAALLWAGFVADPNHANARRPSPWRAALAGLLTGLCCYGYPAARLFIPVFLGGCVLLTWGGWRRIAQSRRGRTSIAMLCLGVAVTFGPLAWEHLVHPETIGRRGQATWVWRAGDSPATRVGKVLTRYARHFDPRFLYLYGDEHEIVWTKWTSYIPPPLLPLQVIGVVLLVRRWRDSAAARVVAAGVLLFPVSDSINWHVSMHGLRSSSGLVPLLILAALGLEWLAGNLKHARRQAAVLAIVAALGLHLTSFAYRYVRRPLHLPVYEGTHCDLLAVHDFLAPLLKRGDRVVFSDRDLNQPYVVWLVADDYDPQRWFSEPREMQPDGDWDRYTRVGDLYFLNDRERPATIESLRTGVGANHVFFVTHPGEDAPGERIGQVVGPDQVPALFIFEAWL